MVVKDSKLVVYTPNAEATLHQLLHIIEKTDEKLIRIDVTKPSLTEIFESLKKK